jgi:hypothetical protein
MDVPQNPRGRALGTRSWTRPKMIGWNGKPATFAVHCSCPQRGLRVGSGVCCTIRRKAGVRGGIDAGYRAYFDRCQKMRRVGPSGAYQALEARHSVRILIGLRYVAILIEFWNLTIFWFARYCTCVAASCTILTRMAVRRDQMQQPSRPNREKEQRLRWKHRRCVKSCFF